MPDTQELPIEAELPVVAQNGDAVTEDEFEHVCRDALGAVGGTMLFKLRVGNGVECQHVAAGAIGKGDGRQFLVLSLPVGGGKLSVETAARSKNPVAKIAAAYAGLADVFAKAA